jgi:hypothetical protein
MAQGASRLVAVTFFAAATTGAAIVDGLTHSSTRPLPTAFVECLPALTLGATVLLSTGRGARSFGLATLALTGRIVATSGTQPSQPLIVLVSLLVASGLLLAAFLQSAAASRAPSHRRTLSMVTPLIVLAGVLTAIGIGTTASLSRTRCGVDNCAYAGLGIAFLLGAAFELTLLAMIVAACSADLRAGAGAALFAVGLNLLLAIAPTWSRYEGVVGVAVGYTGLALTALPWFAPRRAKGMDVSLPEPEPAL